jgi:programmed cell death 6-interacting protein
VAVYYNALSQFYAGVDLHEKDEIGKEIARLTRALELSKDAKNYKISASLREAIDEFEREVNKCLEIAVRDNNKVYHERIPAFDTLDPIEKKRPVKPTVIANLADETNVSDAFFNLFPIPVMEAKVKYTEQVTVKLQNAFRGTREHREKLKQHLAQMGLPGSILAADQKQGFPKDVHDKIQKIESAGGIRRLHELKTTLDEMAVEANQLCEKIKQTLDQEAADDNECRQQYGQRWPRLASQNLTVNLYKQLNEYSSKIKQAQKSDQLVDQKISESKEGFSHFSKPRESIDMLMPSIDVSNANTEFGKSYNDLKQLLGQLDDLFTREEMIEREIADMQRLENIEQTLLKHEGNLDQCVNNELLKYDEKLNQLQPIQQQLDQTMSAIVSANQQFVQRQTTDKQRKREQVIQSMYASINKYHEILANIQEGINFYTTMQDIIKKLQQRVGDFVFARRTEKQDLIANLQTQLSGVPVQPYGAQQPPIGHQPVYQTQQLPYGHQPVYQTQQSQQYVPQQQQRYYNPQQLPPTPYQQQQPQYQYGVQPQNPYGSQPSNRR